MTATRLQALKDPDRLAALRELQLLDTPAEEAFDRLTRLATRLLQVPIALVNLIDEERQFFKSVQGMGDLRELPVGTGVCSYAVAAGKPLMIEDARRDPKFSSNRIVCDYGLVAYIGIPLLTAGGHALGTFCVVDTEPRTWTEEDVSALLDLAAAAMTEIELRATARQEQRRAGDLACALDTLRRREEEIRRIEERFQLVARASNDALWEYDWVTGKLWWSDQFTALFGHESGDPAADFPAWEREVHAEDRARVVESIHSAHEQGAAAWSAEYRFRRADGIYVDVLDRSHIVYGEDGKPLRQVGSIMDVTQRRQAQEAERLLAHSGLVLGASLDFQQTLEEVPRLAVPQLADYCRLELHDENGRAESSAAASSWMAIGADDPTAADSGDPLVRTLAARVLATGDPVLVTTIGRAALRGYPLNSEELARIVRSGIRSAMAVPLVIRGKCLGSLVFERNGSGRAYDQQDLALAEQIALRAVFALENARLYRAAERATAAREEILAVVSHELRSPLQAVLMVVDTLLEHHSTGYVPPPLRKHLEGVRSSARQMSRLVQDLLDITKIEAGHFGIRRLVIASVDLVEEAIEMLQPLADARSVHLEARAARTLPPVLADRERILQVFGNLLSNAIRHSPPGTTVYLDAAEDGEEVRFSVTNTGKRVAKEDLPNIFTPFWRGAEGSGLGLGLAIAHGIAAVHGGKLWAERGRVPGSGMTFHLGLPAYHASNGGEGFGSPGSPAVGIGAPAQLAFETLELHAASPTPPARARGGADWVPRSFQGQDASGAGDDATITQHLRDEITVALHLGYLRAGDRLPSIRFIARTLRVPFQAVVQAYDELAAERLVEKRERSGVFLAAQERSGGELVGETARWVSDVLVGAFQHQIKIPHLPDLIQRLTAAVPLHCVCIESTSDHRTALCAEMSQLLGISAHPLSMADLQAPSTPAELLAADLLVTTGYHAPAVRKVAEALDKPLAIITLPPEITAAIERRVQDDHLTVVCTDPEFGERLQSHFGRGKAGSVRVILCDDEPALAALDRSQPVLLTRAAYERMPRTDLRLLFPISPALAPESARSLAELLIKLNVTKGGDRRLQSAQTTGIE